MTSETKAKIKKAIKITSSVLWWCALGLIFVIMVSVIGAKMTGKVPSVCGYSVMHIISGSMEEEIPQGSYILVKRISPDEVKINDVICFYSEDPTIYGMPNTHRVVEEPINKGGTFEFVTKGDANAAADRINAKGENLIGVYVKTLDGLTAAAKAMNENVLAFVFIGLLISIMGMTAYSIVVIKKRKEDKK